MFGKDWLVKTASRTGQDANNNKLALPVLVNLSKDLGPDDYLVLLAL